jgi:hypothetical protein
LKYCSIKSSTNFFDVLLSFPSFFNIFDYLSFASLINLLGSHHHQGLRLFSERSAMPPLNRQVLKRDLNEGALIGGIVIGVLGLFLFIVWVSIIFRRR